MRRYLKKYCCILLVLVFLTGCGNSDSSISCAKATGDTEQSYPAAVAKTEATSEKFRTIFVHVCGEVKKPGLYELKQDARIGDAVDAAGGFTKDANQASVNLAQCAEDGLQIYVSSESEITSDASGTAASAESGGDSSSGGLININTASASELTELSGIGEARAEAIVSYRQEYGSFSTIEDIKKVSGIGDSIYDRIKDDITTG